MSWVNEEMERLTENQGNLRTFCNDMRDFTVDVLDKLHVDEKLTGDEAHIVFLDIVESRKTEGKYSPLMVDFMLYYADLWLGDIDD